MPLEPEIEERDEIPERIRKSAADMGLFGFALPEEYGGLGLSMEQEARLVFELGYTTPAFRSLFGTNTASPATSSCFPRATSRRPRTCRRSHQGSGPRRSRSRKPMPVPTPPD